MEKSRANNKKAELSDEQLSDLKVAVDVLRKGGVILYPTDTVWGIGCDATNDEAVARVYQIKKRAESKALITLVSDVAMLERTVSGIPDVAYELIDVTDKPLTVVYDKGIGVAPNLLADDGSLAVRLTREPFSASLCRNLRRPLVSTSANISGEPTPSTFNAISDEIKNAVDYICLSRRDESKPRNSSSIIKLSEDGTFKIIR